MRAPLRSVQSPRSFYTSIINTYSGLSRRVMRRARLRRWEKRMDDGPSPTPANRFARRSPRALTHKTSPALQNGSFSPKWCIQTRPVEDATRPGFHNTFTQSPKASFRVHLVDNSTPHPTKGLGCVNEWIMYPQVPTMGSPARATVGRVPHDVKGATDEREEGISPNVGNWAASLLVPLEHTTPSSEPVLLSNVVSNVARRGEGGDMLGFDCGGIAVGGYRDGLGV
ncbi:hypothetical protein BJV78DRAFT_1295965 [Lactifluus subvellereus]|nr:hypothetical protein BJV78DRAFT_1295965 [Lactifluus subvellereus]